MNDATQARSTSPLVDPQFTRDSKGLDHFSTGITALDSALGGGIPARAGVVVKFPAASPGERLGYALATEPDHQTLYATTAPNTALLQGNLGWEQNQRPGDGDLPAHPVSLAPDGDDKNWSALLESPTDCLPMFSEASIVVDSLTDYPTDSLRDALANFLTFVRETNCIAYLLIHDSDLPEHQERARITADVADIVVEYQPAETTEGNDALHIPKLRHPLPHADSLPITLGLDIDRRMSGASGESF